MDINDWKNYSEIAKNLAQVIGLLGAIFVYYKWVVERRDRSTQVLFELERQFNSVEISKGRELIEYNSKYKKIRMLLLKVALPSDEVSMGVKRENTNGKSGEPDPLKSVDVLLRFYVLLCGIREAHQVRDSALRACYRYWLAHYFSPNRREFRLYVKKLYPTLHQWLSDDRRWINRIIKTSFFGPEKFGWYPERHPNSEQLRQALDGRILVLTGAGISADSGIPTYRGKKGFWRNHNPKQLATKVAFDNSPMLVWEWYNWRRNQIREKEPNQAHKILREIGRCCSEFLLVTQNVDDLHERAGSDPSQLVHIHGQIFVNKCTECNFQDRENVLIDPLPRCPQCHKLLRPGVVWFDEELDSKEENRVEDFLARGPCDLVLVIGTSATFDYIVDWALRGIGDTGWLIEINPEETNLTIVADKCFRSRAIDAVPKLFRDVWNAKSDECT